MNRAFSRPTRRAVLWRLCTESGLSLGPVSRVYDWAHNVTPDERLRVYRAAARAGVELPPLAVARPMLPPAACDATRYAMSEQGLRAIETLPERIASAMQRVQITATVSPVDAAQAASQAPSPPTPAR